MGLRTEGLVKSKVVNHQTSDISELDSYLKVPQFVGSQYGYELNI